MTQLLTAAQMRAVETAAIESGRVTGLELMERAGRGVVEAVFEAWPDLARAPRRAVVLCGPGNNGGDGFVVARLLKEWGWEAEVFLCGDPDKLPPDARANCERWRESGRLSAWSADTIAAAEADLFVDAVFGAGLTREPGRDILDPLASLYAAGKTFDKLVAIDAPTGLCMDSGRPLSATHGAVHAALTVTFHRARTGHYLNAGPAHCGAVAVKDIGLSGPEDPKAAALAERPRMSELDKRNSDHKYTHGHALILAGGAGRTGAARLAARGALRVGAGLVTLGVPPAAQQEVAGQISALMLRRVADADALRALLADRRLNALCLGPGLGADRARALVPAALGVARSGPPAGASDAEVPGQARDGWRAVVLDADALTAYEDDPEALFAMLHEGCVLTPHAGEFVRLFADIGERLRKAPSSGPAYSKVDAARAAAQRAGCVVLFKGPDTVIAAPDGRCSINTAQYERAAPWLATAGAGDVLAGFIAGLLARGLAPLPAAGAAAWIHVECARRVGPGLIAEDLPEAVPGVFRSLGA